MRPLFPAPQCRNFRFIGKGLFLSYPGDRPGCFRSTADGESGRSQSAAGQMAVTSSLACCSARPRYAVIAAGRRRRAVGPSGGGGPDGPRGRASRRNCRVWRPRCVYSAKRGQAPSAAQAQPATSRGPAVPSSSGGRNALPLHCFHATHGCRHAATRRKGHALRKDAHTCRLRA